MGPDRVRSRLRHAAPRALRTQGARRLRDAEELLLSEHAALNPDLGLDSISFPTFGWERVVDEPDERVWSSGDGTYLSLNFFPKPPDLPRLDTRDLGPLFGTRRRTITTRPLLIELAVERGGTLPLVRIITRQHVPERERYAFLAALIAPLKTCGWVVKVQALGGNTTGVREALALAEYMRAHPERTAADPLGCRRVPARGRVRAAVLLSR